MAEMPSTPRLLYRGPADETADTRRVADWVELEGALAEGWRLRRIPDPPAEPLIADTPVMEDGPPIADLTDDPIADDLPPDAIVRRLHRRR